MTNYKEDIEHLFSLLYLPIGTKVFCKTSRKKEVFGSIQAAIEGGYIVRYLSFPKDKKTYKPEETKILLLNVNYNDITIW